MRYNYFEYTYKDKNGEIVRCVKCVSHYAQKEVHGIAKCHPNDTFDLEKGRAIAKARCDVKVGEKRFKQALKERARIESLKEYYSALLQKKEEYVETALNELEEYQKILETVDPTYKD